MNKIFKTIGLLGLVIFSFFYTNKTVTVLKENDEIMIKIKENIDKYNIDVKEANIDNDTIIPGINGLKVNINKSYEKMKKMGIYNSKYLVYDVIYPKERLKNNRNKYIISGNNKNNNVSLLFIVNDVNMLDKTIKILNNYKIKSDFFITDSFINKNGYLFNYIKNNGFNLNYYGDYSSSDFITNNTIIKNNFKNNNFCYLENKNKEYLNICTLNKNYTIIPSLIIKNNMLSKVKSNIKKGSLISIYISDISELDLTIKYIKSKGYNIVTLNEIFDF